MPPRWANPNKRRFKRSQAEEARAAALLGGRPLARSGAVKTAPKTDHATTQDGDFRTPQLHAEHKRTELPKMTVERDWLDKVTRGARPCMKTPALVLLFEVLEGEARDWIFLPADYFRTISGSASDTERFRGDMRTTPRASLVLHADRLAELVRDAGADHVPTMALEWVRPERTPSIWVGTTITRCRPWLVEGADHAPS